MLHATAFFAVFEINAFLR